MPSKILDLKYRSGDLYYRVQIIKKFEQFIFQHIKTGFYVYTKLQKVTPLSSCEVKNLKYLESKYFQFESYKFSVDSLRR